ncbi:hypothetical protein B0H15DRAFT_942579 [Mycena belliarum]|uniref:Uncharacterized protein n=1 Tax=Mycena belliarum TaxID=1033014 RepID=A0AAD6UGU9_9AGAR|nr:hypothetical protein B0H15DRAFT_942579 [Mycena belliae]
MRGRSVVRAPHTRRSRHSSTSDTWNSRGTLSLVKSARPRLGPLQLPAYTTRPPPDTTSVLPDFGREERLPPICSLCAQERPPRGMSSRSAIATVVPRGRLGGGCEPRGAFERGRAHPAYLSPRAAAAPAIIQSGGGEREIERCSGVTSAPRESPNWSARARSLVAAPPSPGNPVLLGDTLGARARGLGPARLDAPPRLANRRFQAADHPPILFDSTPNAAGLFGASHAPGPLAPGLAPPMRRPDSTWLDTERRRSGVDNARCAAQPPYTGFGEGLTAICAGRDGRGGTGADAGINAAVRVPALPRDDAGLAVVAPDSSLAAAREARCKSFGFGAAGTPARPVPTRRLPAPSREVGIIPPHSGKTSGGGCADAAQCRHGRRTSRGQWIAGAGAARMHRARAKSGAAREWNRASPSAATYLAAYGEGDGGAGAS